VTRRRVSRAEVAAEVADVAARRADQTVYIGIDGFGAAGKSSLADVLAASVSRVTVVRVDDFAGPGVPEWDVTRFRAQLLEPLLAGRRARYQVWNWHLDAGGEWLEVPPGRVVVVEGVSSTRAEAGVPWDLTIWVDAPRELRLTRALERDGEAILSRWLEEWMPSEEAYAARERPLDRVDLVVSGVE
jgi:uridine kinase